MNLAALRSLTYVYLGTVNTDPAYPATTVTTLLNAVANKYIADAHEMAPSYLRKVATLTATSPTARTYNLPADFSRWLDVRLNNSDGSQLEERRDDEMNEPQSGYVFSVTGPDGSAVLTTHSSVSAGVPLYLKYAYQPAEMVNDGDSPASWMPAQFHDLLAREAAIDAFGLGDEATPSPVFLQETIDRRGQYWYHMGRRGIQPMTVR